MIKTPEQTSVKIIVRTCGRTHMVSLSKLEELTYRKMRREFTASYGLLRRD